MKDQKNLTEQIDALLPQIQCGLCHYPGCLPYAEALAAGQTEIDLCLPGGTRVLTALGTLLAQDITSLLPTMEKKTKLPSCVVIREAECIGCTKCIQACPVDAILGSSKHMHTVIEDRCTGCDLCIPACPVDCMESIPLPAIQDPLDKASQTRQRYHAHQQRIQPKQTQKASLIQNSTHERKNYIQAALARIKVKKQLRGNKIRGSR
ncbi:MAG: hypothetical protein A3E83_09260 [Gammaproteobacteria bacterium RIFCSPHIGHO2_12_FULL_41_20]|nr:MAG: hypothetical protein A3E83_09260 [Gammaproteobacteria bacterium RIFCSPHIGHO2_12_FULL_41_20]